MKRLVMLLAATALAPLGCRDRSERTDRTPAVAVDRQSGSDAAQQGGKDLGLTLTRLHVTNGIVEDYGAIAKERAADPRVRKFAEHLVFDHEADDRRLLALVKEHEITLTELPHPGVSGHGGQTGSVRDRAEPGNERVDPGQTPGTMTGNDPGGGVGMSGASVPGESEGEQVSPGVGTMLPDGNVGGAGTTIGRGADAPGPGLPESAASRTQGASEARELALEVASARAAINSLTTRTGWDFDRDFLTRIAAEHRRAIVAVQNLWSAAAADPAVREYVDGTISMLDAHEKEALRLLESMPAGERQEVRGREK